MPLLPIDAQPWTVRGESRPENVMEGTERFPSTSVGPLMTMGVVVVTEPADVHDLSLQTKSGEGGEPEHVDGARTGAEGGSIGDDGT
jgi:hypothetical protein